MIDQRYIDLRQEEDTLLHGSRVFDTYGYWHMPERERSQVDRAREVAGKVLFKKVPFDSTTERRIRAALTRVRKELRELQNPYGEQLALVVDEEAL